MIRYRYIQWGIALLLVVCVMMAMFTLQCHIIFYQEQHWLFMFTKAYMRQTIESEGIISYLGSFVIQFYYYPWLGAAIVGLMLAAVYMLVGGIIKNLTRNQVNYLGTALGILSAVALYFTLDGIEETPGWLVVALLGTAVLWLLTYAIGQLIARKCDMRDHPISIIKGAVITTFAVAVILGGYWLQVKDYNRQERAMLRAERSVKQKDWDLTLAITDKYLGQGYRNKLMAYLRNIALANKGELLDHLFDHPLYYGVDALAFPWRSNSREAEYGHLMHEYTGNLNAAHHWAFEAMTVWGETAPHLIDLARYNVAMGRPAVAQRFVNKLRNTLFYRGEAKSLQRQIDGEEPPALHYAYANGDGPEGKFINIYYPGANLIEILSADPDNDIARQYLTALLLAANDQDNLMSILEPGKIYPPTVQQAMLIYSLYPFSTPLDTLGLVLMPEVGNGYGRMSDLRRKGDNMLLLKEFGNSFWYYIYNYCPYGADKRNSLGSESNAPGADLNH